MQNCSCSTTGVLVLVADTCLQVDNDLVHLNENGLHGRGKAARQRQQSHSNMVLRDVCAPVLPYDFDSLELSYGAEMMVMIIHGDEKPG